MSTSNTQPSRSIDSDNNTTKQEVPIDKQSNETKQEVSIDKQSNETKQEVSIDKQSNETKQEVPIDKQSNETKQEIPIDKQSNETKQEIPIGQQSNAFDSTNKNDTLDLATCNAPDQSNASDVNIQPNQKDETIEQDQNNVSKLMRDLCERIDTQNANINALDDRIKAQNENINAHINAHINALDDRIKAQNENINAHINALDDRIKAQNENINAHINALNERMKSQIDDVEKLYRKLSVNNENDHKKLETQYNKFNALHKACQSQIAKLDIPDIKALRLSIDDLKMRISKEKEDNKMKIDMLVEKIDKNKCCLLAENEESLNAQIAQNNSRIDELNNKVNTTDEENTKFSRILYGFQSLLNENLKIK